MRLTCNNLCIAAIAVDPFGIPKLNLEDTLNPSAPLPPNLVVIWLILNQPKALRVFNFLVIARALKQRHSLPYSTQLATVSSKAQTAPSLAQQ